MFRPKRQTDYSSIPPEKGLVVDNGAFACRVGWGGELSPRFSFRNVLNKPRHRATGEIVTIVGNYSPELVKLFDFTRASLRTPFDANVVYQFDMMETIMDYCFERMGVNESKVDHPVLMTECPCNPAYSRNKVAELMFEGYGVPSVAFGIGGVFSYQHNQKLGNCGPNGMLVCSAHMATHCIPMYNGEPIIESCCRTGVGGYHVTDYLKQIFCLQHPFHALSSSASVMWENIEALKQECCYVAEDYNDELECFQRGGERASQRTKLWEVPWAPAPQNKEKEQVDEEELARKAAIKEKQGQRLRDMAASKRSAKITNLEAELEELGRLLEEIDGAEVEEVEAILEQTDYSSKQEVLGRLTKVSASLKKMKGEQVDPPKDQAEVPISEKYPLLVVPDRELTEDQLRQKKRQKFLKLTSEGRAKAKQKREEEGLQKELEQQVEEERRRANPEEYLEKLRTKVAELATRVHQRKRQKTGSSSNSTALTTGAGGRGERLTVAQRERMKMLASAAFDRGKEEDTFGMNDEDWQLYKKIGKDDNEPEEDEIEYNRLTARLKELDPSFASAEENDNGNHSASQDLQQRQLTDADHRIHLGVELFRCPEILFQPSMIGLDQAGIGEAVSVCARRLPEALLRPVTEGCVFLTGGNALFPGFDVRMFAEVRKCRPLGAEIKVVKAADPLLDAWKGAASFASTNLFHEQAVSKAEYEETGHERLRTYHLKYC